MIITVGDEQKTEKLIRDGAVVYITYMELGGIEETMWWKYMEPAMQDLMRQSFDLIYVETQRLKSSPPYHDYSFVVFPAAKAYEGFLKTVFRDMKLITNQQFYGDNFRIGRALSPTLPKRYRVGWVYGRLVDYCKGDDLPMAMWDVWKRARNRIFHFFPQHKEHISLNEAEELVKGITTIMDRTLRGCRVGGFES